MYKATLLSTIIDLSNNKRNELNALKYVNKFIDASTAEAAFGTSISIFGYLSKAGRLLPRALGVVDGTSKLTPPENRVPPFLRSQLFIALIASTEDYLSQVLKEVLLSFPNKIKDTSIGKERILQSNSIQDIIEEMIVKHVTDIFYAKPAVYKVNFLEVISAPKTLLDSVWDAFVEMKATRDIAMHSAWRSNDVYLQKAGPKARTNKPDVFLGVSESYFNEAIDTCTEIIDQVEIHIKDKFQTCTRTTIFKEMWDSSSLNKVVKFDDAWDLESAEMVRPKKGFEWAWSHSEEILFKFMQGIYYGEKHMPTFPFLIQRSSKKDVKLIKQWLENPFFF